MGSTLVNQISVQMRIAQIVGWGMLDGWFKFKWTIAHFKGVLRFASKIWGTYVPLRSLSHQIRVIRVNDKQKVKDTSGRKTG